MRHRRNERKYNPSLWTVGGAKLHHTLRPMGRKRIPFRKIRLRHDSKDRNGSTAKLDGKNNDRIPMSQSHVSGAQSCMDTTRPTTHHLQRLSQLRWLHPKAEKHPGKTGAPRWIVTTYSWHWSQITHLERWTQQIKESWRQQTNRIQRISKSRTRI